MKRNHCSSRRRTFEADFARRLENGRTVISRSATNCNEQHRAPTRELHAIADKILKFVLPLHPAAHDYSSVIKLVNIELLKIFLANLESIRAIVKIDWS